MTKVVDGDAHTGRRAPHSDEERRIKALELGQLASKSDLGSGLETAVSSAVRSMLDG